MTNYISTFLIHIKTYFEKIYEGNIKKKAFTSINIKKEMQQFLTILPLLFMFLRITDVSTNMFPFE